MQPAISGKRRSEQKEERIERMWMSDRGQRSKGGLSQGAMEDKEDGGASLFLHQIVDFTPAPAQPVF